MKAPLKHLAKETAFVIMAFVCMFVLILITSIGDAQLDFDKIYTKKNLSVLLINATITVFGIIASIPSGMVSTKQKLTPTGQPGRYLTEFANYTTVRAKIEAFRSRFTDWHQARYLQELHDKQVHYLLSYNVYQPELILKLSREQILELDRRQVYDIDGEECVLRALTYRQIEACLRVYDGKITVHKLPDFYFLYIDGKGKRTFYDQAYYESQDETFTMVSNVIYKVFIGFVTTCIFTGLVVSLAEGEELTVGYVLNALLIMFTRILNAVSSTMWGQIIGQEMVYQQCYYINGKTQFLQAFSEDMEREVIPNDS